MSPAILNTVISLTALFALVRLWDMGGGLWWVVLVLMVVNLFVGATASKAVEIGSKDFVIRFWRRAQLFVNSVCFTVSLASILYTYR